MSSPDARGVDHLVDAIADFAHPIAQVHAHALHFSRSQPRAPKARDVMRETLVAPLRAHLETHPPEDLAAAARVLVACTDAVIDDVVFVQPVPRTPLRRRLVRMVWPHLEL